MKDKYIRTYINEGNREAGGRMLLVEAGILKKTKLSRRELSAYTVKTACAVKTPLRLHLLSILSKIIKTKTFKNLIAHL